jgi:hypothetical protein
MPTKAKPLNLIRSYGLFWRLDETEWLSKRHTPRPLRLLGRRGGQVSDFWRQWGLYVMYGNYGPYYVGISSQLGKRLHNHHKSERHHDKWDRFSWFGFNEIGIASDSDGIALIQHPTKIQRGKTSEVKFSHALSDIESVLFRAMSPVGNDATPAFGDPSAKEWKQVKLHEVDDLLRRIKP